MPGRELQWVTLFHPATNTHLIKDVGMVPKYVQRSGLVRTTLVCYANDAVYSHLDGEASGLQIRFIRNTGKWFFLEKAVLSFLWRESQCIDVLHLFHLSQESLVYGLLYKMLNPTGILYIKADVDAEQFRREKRVQYSKKMFNNRLFKTLERAVLQRLNLMTVETREALSEFHRAYASYTSIIRHLPNGVSDRSIDGYRQTAPLKENWIITVGRLGTDQKNTSMLLDAVSRLRLGKWRVALVGPVTESFARHVDQWRRDNPAAAEAVALTGEVNDRKQLYDWYSRARIFCLTSRWESFGLVLAEAMYCGAYVVTTPVSSAVDMTANGRWGSIVPFDDPVQLASELCRLMEDGDHLDRKAKEAQMFCRRELTWSKISSDLIRMIFESSPNKD